MVTAVASQLVSPIIWAHYAVILLLPVALLLERRQWWAAALPIVTWLPIDAIYPVVFAIGLLAPLAVGEQQRRSATPGRTSRSGRAPGHRCYPPDRDPRNYPGARPSMSRGARRADRPGAQATTLATPDR